MKEIRAYIQPFMLATLTQTLLDIPHFPGMRVSDCDGYFGCEKVIEKHDFTLFVTKKRIEIFAQDELVDSIVNAIRFNANTHQQDVEDVYIINVDEGWHTNSGVRGNDLV
ncbi:MAG: P-II family nitrogen regulator [Methylococcaceae bacterium]